MKIALIVPIYQPTEFVMPFLKRFNKGDFDKMVVVDDGSGSDFDKDFEEVRSLGLFTLIRLPKNKGKGKAMKVALRYLKKEIPDLDGFLTADGDGQHAYEDILKVRAEFRAHPDSLILGARQKKDMPKKSLTGSIWSTRYFKLMTGVKMEDTQTGLRAIPKSLFSSFLASPGNRYEFEMGFLAGAARESRVLEVPIQTIYLKDNASTHYRVFRDSMRIAYFPIAYLLNGILLGAIDVLFFRFLYMDKLSGSPLAPLYSSLSASFLVFFLYELLTHCGVFFVKPRFKKVVVDFFAFVFLSLVSFGIALGFNRLGLSWTGGMILADACLYLLLILLKCVLPSGVAPAYIFS